ncbi:E3 SUMO-protein ligase ZBED1 isoform X1 [Anthonomus grandis grandis]|uniref:E3 SUMO-protein ligase ZBED1 isoform X1 n=1 Tax=Anthonomus grandis grandis TaxID=2921223 RepID=UPI0021655795|nr:E3 SUMO-protein ligase ZBED1 isoform X1 [Anthonomus grandis grandis]
MDNPNSAIAFSGKDNFEILGDIGTSSTLSMEENSSCSSISSAVFPVHRQSSVKETFSTIKSFSDGGVRAGKITNAITYMIAKDNLPLNTVEKDGFKYLMKVVVPLYRPPSRHKMSTLIEEKYNFLSEIIRCRIQSLDSITLTTDVWTETQTTTSFLGVTGHFLLENKLNSITIGVYKLGERHTSEYLGQCLSNMCADWKIPHEKITAIVTDNGANVVKAISDLFGKNRHLPCFAHTLDLVASKVIEEEDVKVIINKVKTIVTYFKQSVVAADELRIIQPANNTLRLIQSVPTRWNSTYLMLERFLSLCEYIVQILLKNSKAPTMLGASDVDTIKELLHILGPIKTVSEEVSGEQYVTASKIIPIINCLFKKIDSLSPLSKEVIALKKSTRDELLKRFGAIEQNLILAVSTILDPRFKKLHFNSPVVCSKTISFINQSIKNLREQNTQEKENILQEDQTPSTSKSSDLWSYHKELAAKHCHENTSDSMNQAFKLYLVNKTIPISDDPIKYWSKEPSSNLKELALKYLSIVGTSVPSERLFSKAGNIISLNRNRLSSEKLQQLLFLSSVKYEDWNLE